MKSISKAVGEIEELWHSHIDERPKRKKDRTATIALEGLLSELLKMCNSEEWEHRYAALRGLKMTAFTKMGERRMDEIVPLLLVRIRDDDGRVRQAAVYALDMIRMSVSEDLYVGIYLKLQDMYDREKDIKKKKSIDFALSKLSCPYFDVLMEARGYCAVEHVGG